MLIGTQMIVKGHDFPQVTLVGVLAADLSLSVSDYHAGERTFQLLTQAVGRAGRGVLPGEAVIQTYQPNHYAVVRAAGQDYEGFYQEEILYREIMGYPPASHMLAVQIFAKEESRGSSLAGHLAETVRKSFPEVVGECRDNAAGKGERQHGTQDKAVCGIQLIGPAPAAIGRINDIFRFVFYIKCPKYAKLIQIKDKLEEEWKLHPSQDEMIQFDFDPVNIL